MAAISRRRLIHRGAVGGLALLGAASLAAGPARSEPSRADEVSMLGVALSLEHVQARFYSQAARVEAIRPDLLEFARIAAAHEEEHIAALRALLGPAAGAAPRIDLWQRAGDDAAFAHMAVRLEDLSVRALNGLAGALSPAALAETARIASVDARHAAWIRGLVGVTPAHHVRDEGRTTAEMAEALERVGLSADLLT